MSARTSIGSTLIALLGFGLACGEDPAPPASHSASMDARVDGDESPAQARIGNQAPIISHLRFEPGRPYAMEPIRVEVNVNDPDGDPVELSYQWTVNGTEMRGNSPGMTFPRARKGQRIEVRVTANDGAQTSVSELETRFRNRPPQLLSVRLEPEGQIQSGTDIVARPTAEDGDGDPVSFEYDWQVGGRSVGVEGDTFETGSLRRGDRVRVTVVAGDGQDRSEALDGQELEIANSPPEIVSTPTQTGEDGVFRYALEVEDADGDRVFRYRLDKGPDGMEVDLASGEVVWKPREDQVGTFPIEVVVDDRKGGMARQSFDLDSGFETVPAPAAAPPAAPTP